MVDINRISVLIEKHRAATEAVASIEKEIADLFAGKSRTNPYAFRQNQLYGILATPMTGKQLVASAGVSEVAVRSAIRDLVKKKRIKFDRTINMYRRA